MMITDGGQQKLEEKPAVSDKKIVEETIRLIIELLLTRA